MIHEALNSFGFALDYLRRLIADVPTADLTRQPAGVVNHPAWSIGHLAFSCQAIGGEVGLAAWLPPEWATRYGTGSVPIGERSAYPSNEALVATLAEAQARLTGRLRELGEEGMAALLPDERYRHLFPTVGHAVLHILTVHTAMHVGQLVVWRRAAGYPPVSEPFA